jgi:hypothetical protein
MLEMWTTENVRALRLERKRVAPIVRVYDRLHEQRNARMETTDMPKKISDLSKVIKFFTTAEEAAARTALDAAATIVGERFAPVKVARKGGRRKKEQDVPLPLGEQTAK